ncbi:DMT family transporter [Kineosporia mesophila]|uniref:DMT family transporter n=1 Tax=Kineosporia mesophila TaxID=566012 RepID=UPI001E450DBD|nr:multidrug efflux SMR transporter [Kineosporia mesophila]
MAWLALAGAIVLEITATISLKTADGFTRFWPSLIVVVGYIGCFGLLGFALKTLDVGLVYALWSAVGTAAITLLAVVMFGETITLPRIGGLLLIILGVIVVNLSGGEAHAVGDAKVTSAPAPAPVPPVPQQRVQGPESGEVPMLTPRSGLIPRQMRPRHDMKTDPDSDLAPVFPDLGRPGI